ncbi:hypothetical protein BH11PLA1_BH11PLA1_16260 [soil metagenome]
MTRTRTQSFSARPATGPRPSPRCRAGVLLGILLLAGAPYSTRTIANAPPAQSDPRVGAPNRNSTAAYTDDAEAPPRALADIVADLGAASFPIRDAASRELDTRSDLTLAQFGAELSHPGLPLESRARLLTAAHALFARTPRGALGVQFAAVGVGIGPLNPREGGQVVGRLLPGFPAGKTLRSGDVIVAVNGERVTGVTTFTGARGSLRPMVIARDPGSSVTVTVLRVRTTPPAGAEPDAPPEGGADAANPAVPKPRGPALVAPKDPAAVPADIDGVIDLSRRDRLDILVELGSFDGLSRQPAGGGMGFFADTISADQLAEAWEIRKGDLLGPPPPPQIADLARLAGTELAGGVQFSEVGGGPMRVDEGGASRAGVDGVGNTGPEDPRRRIVRGINGDVRWQIGGNVLVPNAQQIVLDAVEMRTRLLRQNAAMFKQEWSLLQAQADETAAKLAAAKAQGLDVAALDAELTEQRARAALVAGELARLEAEIKRSQR